MNDSDCTLFRRSRNYLFALLLGLLAAGCGGTRPTVKIGLVAPFEGRYRELGYEVIYAVRLAVRQANAAGGVAGYSVELTALDDGGDPAQAAEQAAKLRTDPQIVAVIGHWLDETTAAAAETYAAAGLPLVATAPSPALPPGSVRMHASQNALLAAMESAAPDGLVCACGLLDGAEFVAARPAGDQTWLVGGPLWGLGQFPALADTSNVAFAAPVSLPSDGDFITAYEQIANGASPGIWAALAYDATQVALAALAADIQANGAPSRAGVATLLPGVEYDGLSGLVAFDAGGEWQSPPVTVYTWEAGALVPYSTTP